MPQKIPWPGLRHDQHIQILAEKTIDRIINEYELPCDDAESPRAYVTNRLSLWNPGNLAAGSRTSNALPSKDPLIAAARDLDRSEALLELIDNSVDAWMLRRRKYPAKTAKQLIIRIMIDEDKHQLTYEDNSGGLTERKLPHLVIPGLSDTRRTAPHNRQLQNRREEGRFPARNGGKHSDPVLESLGERGPCLVNPPP